MLKKNKIYLKDCIAGMKDIDSESVDVILIDPPYNIGKDFGNTSDKREFNQYLEWTDQYLVESKRVLKRNGTMYIYGIPEHLAYVSTRIGMPHRWLIWSYTNKNTPTAKFWQRSHEAILVVWKDEPIFNLDDVREPYTDSFLKNAAGKKRKSTAGRFSTGDKETVYQAHEKGALPRDVLRVPALAGGAGSAERWFYCPQCKEAFSNKEKKDHEKHGELTQHPTQKPYELTKKLLLAAKPKDKGLVLVPFVGSGAELIVAKDLGLDFLGFEINKDYVNLANSFLKKK
jgi:site-specific DNA-methyltransferase (adenine-specific)